MNICTLDVQTDSLEKAEVFVVCLNYGLTAGRATVANKGACNRSVMSASMIVQGTSKSVERQRCPPLLAALFPDLPGG